MLLLIHSRFLQLLQYATILIAFVAHPSRTFHVVVFPNSVRHSFRHNKFNNKLQFSSDWGDFKALDDYDDEDNHQLEQQQRQVDRNTYAQEEDSQELKAQIGSTRPPPSIEFDAAPIFVPQGTVLELTEDNVLGVLSACRQDIGTMFGYTEENRGVGITGGVDYVDLDGPTVILRLKGRFWHQRTTVLARVGAYLMGRIPEIVQVEIEDEWQLTDQANEEW